jgi:hypothetical protein
MALWRDSILFWCRMTQAQCDFNLAMWKAVVPMAAPGAAPGFAPAAVPARALPAPKRAAAASRPARPAVPAEPA